MRRTYVVGLVGLLSAALLVGSGVPTGLPRALASAAARESAPKPVDRATLKRHPDPTSDKDIVGNRSPVKVDPDDYRASKKERKAAERLVAKADATRPQPLPDPVPPAEVADSLATIENLDHAGLTPDYENLGEAAYDRSMAAAGASRASSSGSSSASGRSAASAAAVSCVGASMCASYTVLGDMDPQPTYQSVGLQRLTIKNTGTTTWTSTPTNTVQYKLGYHLKRNGVDYAQTEFLTVPIPASVPPQASFPVTAVVQALPKGTYEVQWDLIKLVNGTGAGQYWFHSAYSVPGGVSVVPISHHAPTLQYEQPMLDGATVDTVTPALKVTVYHDESETILAKFTICQSEIGVCTSSSWLPVTSVAWMRSTRTWTVPPNVLYWNRAAQLKVELKDGSVERPASPPIGLVPVVVQPTTTKFGADAFVDSQGVSLVNGSYSRSETDLSLPGPNGALSLPRTYASGGAGGAFGLGWSSVLDAYWRQTAGAATVTIKLPDGSVRTYGRNPDGTYGGPVGEPVNFQLTPSTRSIIVSGTVYEFDPSGLIASISRPGSQLRFHSNDDGEITSVADVASGRTLYLAWTYGVVVSESTGPNATGLVWRFTYTDGRLTSVADARGAVYKTDYTYSSGRLVLIAPPLGQNRTSISYAADGKVAAVVLPDGTWIYTRTQTPTGVSNGPAVRTVVKVTDPRSSTWYGYDQGGALLLRWVNHESPQAGDYYRYNYNFVTGQLISEIDENGQVVGNYTYDPGTGQVSQAMRYGDIPGTTWTEGVITSYTYIEPYEVPTLDRTAGKLKQTVNANYGVTSYTYLANGQVATAKEPISSTSSATTRYQYTCLNDGTGDTGQAPVFNDPTAPSGASAPCELLSVVIDPTGAETRYGYNSHGDLARVTEPSGRVIDTTYDVYGRAVIQKISSPQDPGGATTTYTYDAVGNLVTETGPVVVNPVNGDQHQLKTTTTYSATGQPTQKVESDTKDTAGQETRTTTYAYDTRGRQTKVTRDGVVTSRADYNPFGQPIRVWDGNANLRVYSYTSQGQLGAELLTYINLPWEESAGQFRTIFLQSYGYDPAGHVALSRSPMGTTTYYDYTARDELAKAWLGTPDQVDVLLDSYEYDRQGNVTAQISGSSASGFRRTEMTYDLSSRRRTITTDPSSFSGANALNRTIEHNYDAAGRLLSQTSVGDGTAPESTSYSFTPAGQLERVDVLADNRSLVTAYSSDAWGNPLAITSPRGYLPNDETGYDTDPAYTKRFTYDAQGRLSTSTDPPAQADPGTGAAPTSVAAKTTVGYNAFGDITHTKGPRGDITVTTYDKLGRKTKVTVPAADGGTGPGASEQWEYDGAGNVTAYTDRRGAKTTYQYDSLNRLVQVTRPKATSTAPAGREQFRYDNDSNVVSHYTVDGAFETFDYDNRDRLTAHTFFDRFDGTYDGPGMQDTTRYTYNDFGDLLTETASGGSAPKVTSYTYNKAGQPKSVSVTGRGTTTWTYDAHGRPATETTPAPHSVVLSTKYDGARRLIESTRTPVDGGAPQATEYRYDLDSNLIETTDPRGYSWHAGYDALGRQTDLTDPAPSDADGAALAAPHMSYGYDAVGNQTKAVDANGNATYTAYDLRNQPVKTTMPSTDSHPATADRTWTTTYDAGGLPTRLTEPGGVTRDRTYDNLGRLTNETGTGAAKNASRQFTYDTNGNILTVNEPGDTRVFAYNDHNQVISTYNSTGGGSYEPDTFSYDPSGLLLSKTTSSRSTFYTYSAGLLTSSREYLKNGSPTDHNYTYDAAGRIAAASNYGYELGRDGTKRAWTYDRLGRLANQTIKRSDGVPTGSASYSWDLNDNLAQQSATGDLQTAHSDWRYTYDEANRLISAADLGSDRGDDYAWDPAGNLTKLTPWTGTQDAKQKTAATTYEYDERNRLAEIDAPAADRSYTYASNGTLASILTDPASGSSTTRNLGFDAFGRLITDSAAGAGEYSYDGLDRLFSPAGALSRYGYEGLGREPSYGPGFSVARLPDGTPFVEKNDATGQVSDLLLNPHGDTVARVNSDTAAIAGTTTYDPFGAATTSGGAATRIGWQGSISEPASGLVHADARWYDPSSGRFLSQDTQPAATSSAASANLYAYGNANPTTYADPSGHSVSIPFPVIPLPSIGEIASSAGRAVASGLGAAAAQGARTLGSQAVKRGIVATGGILADLALGGVTASGVATVGLAILATVAVVGAGYIIYKLVQSHPTTTASPGAIDSRKVTPTIQAKPAPAPTRYQTRTYTTTSQPVTVRRWNDGQNVYVKTVTYTTTHTVSYYTDGTKTSIPGDPVKDPAHVESVPLFDLATAHHDQGTGVVKLLDFVAPDVAAGSGTCGAGGSVATCAPDRQPGQPRAPTAQNPTPQPGGGGFKPPPPPRQPNHNTGCEPDDGAGSEARGGVYSLRDSLGNVVRTGRTKDLAARELAHANDSQLGRFEFRVEYRTDVYAQQRGLEQVLYDRNPGAQAANGGLNKIRGISPKNPNGPGYMNAAQDYLDAMDGC